MSFAVFWLKQLPQTTATHSVFAILSENVEQIGTSCEEGPVGV